MKLPSRVMIIIKELYERNKALAHGTDDDRRAITLKIAQQVRFELGENWGTKKASESRPLSKDAIAQKQLDNGLFAWDWQDGTTRGPAVEPTFWNIPEQIFVPVEPINHLSVNEPPVEPPSNNLEIRLTQVENKVLRMERIFREI